MQSLILLALSALAAAAPQANYGYWDVIYNTTSAANGYRARHVNSTYHNARLPGGKPVNVLCSYSYIPGNNPPETSSCTDKTFTYSYDGANITLAQTVKLSGKKTRVSGSGPLAYDYVSPVGRSFGGKAKVKVSKAVPA